jgi:two-component system chemotaxis response regulator CheY
MDKSIKILLADDSAFMRKILIDILKSYGYENFIEVANGKDAIDKFKSEKPDLCLFDIVMPEVDGLQAIKEIGKEAKIIVVSAVGQEAIVTEAKENGALGYIVKPFEKEKVLSEIEKVLS